MKDRYTPRQKKELAAIPVHYSDALLPAAQNFYNRLPKLLQIQLEGKNNGVRRMGGLRAQGIIPDRLADTNQEHIVRAMQMAREYMSAYPILQSSIDFALVHIYLGIHDTGEIVKKIGDVSPVGRTQLDEVRKVQEPFVAKKRIFSQIPDAKLHDEVVAYYDNYIKDDPNDLNVQMARFIDKVEGTLKVAEVGFSVNKEDDRQTGRMIHHLWVTMGNFEKPAKNLINRLPDAKQKDAMLEIVHDILDKFESYGGPEVVKAYRSSFPPRHHFARTNNYRLRSAGNPAA